MRKVIKFILKLVGKRIANYHSPAKPFDDGVYFLSTVMQKPKWIIDIGVADGTPDITNIFPYHSFNYLLIEANPKFYSILDSVENNHPENVFVEKVFCGEMPGETLFYPDETGRGSSKYPSDNNQESIIVKVTTLDSLAKKHKVDGPIFLKIDVEGAEVDVLKGASETLRCCDVVILESWINPKHSSSNSNFSKLIEIMDSHGFAVFDFFGGHSYKNGVLKMLDLVFVKKDSKYRHIA